MWPNINHSNTTISQLYASYNEEVDRQSETGGLGAWVMEALCEEAEPLKLVREYKGVKVQLEK